MAEYDVHQNPMCCNQMHRPGFYYGVPVRYGGRGTHLIAPTPKLHHTLSVEWNILQAPNNSVFHFDLEPVYSERSDATQPDCQSGRVGSP